MLAAVVYFLRNDRARGAGALIVLVCAVLAGSLLTGVVTEAGWQTSKGRDCGENRRSAGGSAVAVNLALYSFLRMLPKRAIIAGDPKAIDCVPIEAERGVVISRKLYQPFDYTFLKIIRPRMADMLQAYYGPSRRAIADLGTRYGATDLVINRKLLTAHATVSTVHKDGSVRGSRPACRTPAAPLMAQRCTFRGHAEVWSQRRPRGIRHSVRG